MFENKPITNNKILRSKKFFLCIHQCTEKMIGFESAKERFTQFTYLCYGSGKFHFFYDDIIKTIEEGTAKKLYDLRKYVNCDVVGQSKENTKFISFNPWRKTDKWDGRLININEKTIKSNYDYSCLVCFEGKCIVNNKEFGELDVADLVKGKEYNISLEENCYVGLFELIS